MEHRTTLVLATYNRSKARELAALLQGLAVDVVSLTDACAERIDLVEDAFTFEENAISKATAAARALKMLALADDSGLEVDALGGRPGVRSARFAHDRATDAENNAALLAALAEVEPKDRSARFRCVLALVDPWAEPGAAPIVVEGRCEGSIAREPRGAGGFGYDPLFVVEGTGRTMAELSDEEKNRASHRARAVQALRPALAGLLDERLVHSQRLGRR